MFISAEQPTRSVRTARSGDEAWLVAAGGSFKPGDFEEAEATLKDLVELVRAEFGIDAIDYQWVNEDYESMDGMPLVGRASSSAEHLYVADRIQRLGHYQRHGGRDDPGDLISGRDNPWAAVFDATRIKPLAGAKSFTSENIGTGAELIGGYLKGERARSTSYPQARPPLSS